AGTDDVAFEIDRAVAPGSDGSDDHFVAVHDCKRFKRVMQRGQTVGSGAHAERFAMIVGGDALDADVSQRGADLDSASIVKYFGELGLAFQFVDRRTFYAAHNGDLRTRRGNENGVAVLQLLRRGADAVQEKVVQINVAHNSGAAHMTQCA